MLWVYYIAGGVALLAALRVITASNAVHALLYLIVTLLAVALMFFLMRAPFAAALQVIVYAGAIMVLMVFVIMMLNQGDTAARQEKAWLSGRVWAGPALLSLILAVQLVWLVASAGAIPAQGPAPVDAVTVAAALYGPYVLLVELASMLLLAALVGAWQLARRL